jgi:hypothetical protein
MIRYILEIHRIPTQASDGPKKAVFIQHGVVESSGTWLVNPSSRSLRNIANQKNFVPFLIIVIFIDGVSQHYCWLINRTTYGSEISGATDIPGDMSASVLKKRNFGNSGKRNGPVILD